VVEDSLLRDHQQRTVAPCSIIVSTMSMNEHRAAVEHAVEKFAIALLGRPAPLDLQPLRAAMPCPMQIGAVLASSTVAVSRWLKALAVSSAVGIWLMSTGTPTWLMSTPAWRARQEAQAHLARRHLLGEQAPHDRTSSAALAHSRPAGPCCSARIRRCFAL